MQRTSMVRPPVAAIIGFLAAAVALGVTELVAGLLPGGGSPFVAVGEAVIGLTPGPVVRFAISTFGSGNRLVRAPGLGATIGVWALFVLLRSGVSATASPTSGSGSSGSPPAAQDPRIVAGSRRGFLVLAASMARSAATFAVAGRSLQARTLAETARTTTPIEAAVNALPAPPPATMFRVPGTRP